ncbi:alginate export family protein [Alteromonas sp. a30]|uniref:alginate export family protein n=1 Tax=Alteromonas sp. a30 TaxID=2730917 RepID=UPI00227E402A|nr:alginate export family protein [Alteromonas sp. a30]MCY7294772.1 alginate export family protein [Alteromonas sp. a30]
MKLPTSVLLTTVFLTAPSFAEWKLSGDYRLRMEFVDNPIRESSGSEDHALSHRLRLQALYKQDSFYFKGELQDSRMWLDDEGTPIGTDDINAVEPVQAHIGWLFDRNGDTHDLKLGRFSVDIGKRRFISRSRYRNTQNSFTGVYYSIKQPTQWWQFIYASPDNRFPRDRDSLDGNQVKLDKPYFDNVLYGLHLTSTLNKESKLESFYYGLNESDQEDLATRNRQLHTFGLRLTNQYRPDDWGYEFAGSYQIGDARASSSASDVTDLDVKAYFLHSSFGYQFTDSLNSRLLFEFDYATGDDDANDDEYNRFDSLFGLRRFDFGATNLWGVFARANIVSPGVRWKFKPGKDLSAFLGYRIYWLDSTNDQLTPIRALNNEGEDFVGHQFETRLRWKVSNNFKWEMGGVYFIKEDFFDNASRVEDDGNASYFYTQATYSF